MGSDLRRTLKLKVKQPDMKSLKDLGRKGPYQYTGHCHSLSTVSTSLKIGIRELASKKETKGEKEKNWESKIVLQMKVIISGSRKGSKRSSYPSSAIIEETPIQALISPEEIEELKEALTKSKERKGLTK
ncbi:hypothetical protein CR513_17197, partial [Mucuna pruriens]